jgi:3-oxoacyl-[acyl-carrier protein] reductase
VNTFDWEEEIEPCAATLRPQRHTHLRTDLCGRWTHRAHGAGRPQALEASGHLINNLERGGWPVVHGPYVREQWDLEMETTLRAKRWVFAAALPHLKASGDGAVINLSSIAAIVGRSGPAAPVFNDGYAAASRAVSLLTETWAREAAPEVRVNEIMLGFVETRHGPAPRLGFERRGNRPFAATPCRTGIAADVVRGVVFICGMPPVIKAY